MSFPPPGTYSLPPSFPLPLTHSLNTSYPYSPITFPVSSTSISTANTSTSSSSVLNFLPPSTLDRNLNSYPVSENGPRIKRPKNNESQIDYSNNSSSLVNVDPITVNQTISKIEHCIKLLISEWKRQNKSRLISDLISFRRNSSSHLKNEEIQKLEKTIDSLFSERKVASPYPNKQSSVIHQSLMTELKINLNYINRFLSFDQFYSFFSKFCLNQQEDLVSLMWMNNLCPRFSIHEIEMLIKLLVHFEPSYVLSLLRLLPNLKQISPETALILYNHAFKFIHKEYLQFLMVNIAHLDAIDRDGNTPLQLSIIHGGFFTSQILNFVCPPKAYLPLPLTRHESPPFRHAVTRTSFGEWEIDKIPNEHHESKSTSEDKEQPIIDNYSTLQSFFSQQHSPPIKASEENGKQYSLEQNKILKNVNNEGKNAFEMALENPKLFSAFNILSIDFDINLDFAQYTKLLIKYTSLETLDRLDFLLNKINDKQPHLKANEIIINLILWGLPAEIFKKNELMKIIEWFENKGYFLTKLSFQSLISLSLERESPLFLNYLIKKDIVNSTNINTPLLRYELTPYVVVVLSHISGFVSQSLSAIIDLIIPLQPNFQDAILKIFFSSSLERFLKINELLLVKNIHCDFTKDISLPHLPKLSLANYTIFSNPPDMSEKMEWLVDEGIDIDYSMNQIIKVEGPISWKVMQYFISHHLAYEPSQCDNQFSDDGLPLLLHFIKTSQWDKLYYFIGIGSKTNVIDDQGRGLFTYLIQNTSFELESVLKKLQNLNKPIDAHPKDIASAILLLTKLSNSPDLKDRYPFKYAFSLIRRYILNSNLRLPKPLTIDDFQKSIFSDQNKIFFNKHWENIAFVPLISNSNLGYHNTINESDLKQIEGIDPFLEIESLWKSIDFTTFESPINRDNYTPYTERELKEKINTILQTLKQRLPLTGTPPSEQPDLLNQFYDQILFKLKVILFSFRKRDVQQVASQIQYNQEQINSFFLNLFEASFYCPGGWLGYLQMMYTLLNGSNLDIPTQFKTLVTQFRHHIVHQWSIKHAPEDKQLHLYLALLQKHGTDRLGIPDAKNIIDHIGYLPPLLEGLFLLYDFDHENSPTKIIDYMEQQIHFPSQKIKEFFDRFFVADFMKTHFVGDWKKEEFEFSLRSLLKTLENGLREEFSIKEIIENLQSIAEANEINLYPVLQSLSMVLSETESISTKLQTGKTLLTKAVQQSREDAFIASGMIYEENKIQILRSRIIQSLLDFELLAKNPHIDLQFSITPPS